MEFTRKEVPLRFKVVFFVFILLLFASSAAFAYEEIKNLSLPSQGIEKLEIDCGAGFLKIFGREDLISFEAEAVIVLEGMSDEKAQRFIREKVDLSLEKRGTRAVLISKIKRHTSFFSFRRKLINLTVNMPKNCDLYIDDGSGAISVENIQGRVDVEDGSGTMDIKHITGDVAIDDGSGSIRVIGVNGNVNIDDSSGDVRVEDVTGRVSVDDGSGTIYIMNIGADVTVSDGSGSIRIDGVEGNVTIEDDGSGGVGIKNVRGTVRK